MNRFKYTLLLLSLAFFSCDDFLERAPELNLDEDKVFTDFTNAEKFHNDIYSHLKKGFNMVGDWQPVPLASASDEADTPAAGAAGTYMVNNGGYDGFDADISHYYTGIRKANEFIANIHRVPFPDERTRKMMTGEVYFLRAFYFNELVKRFGGMPIMDETNMLYPNDNLQKSRNTYAECVNFILSDLEIAIENLPITLYESEMGRATKGAAMAMKARVLLYAASPLWQKEMGKSLWVEAAEAAKAVIDLKDEEGAPVYELYDNGRGAEDYAMQFFTRRNNGNKEVIFYKHDVQRGFEDIEIKLWAPAGGKIQGVGWVNPTQNFVDLYEMAETAKLIDEPGSGYMENGKTMYDGRDPRFYKTILYHNSEWQGERLDMTYNEVEELKGEYRKGTITGYYVCKYVPEEVKFQSDKTAYHNWIYYRLAEMYLNYAEALNETLAAPDSRVYDAVNKVRARSGVKPLPDGLDKDQMRKRIWNERAVELAFEEHRWFDARRWLKATDWFAGPIYEMRITKDNNSGELVYEKKVISTRVFSSHNNLYPIPISEMRKNPLWVQNPGY